MSSRRASTSETLKKLRLSVDVMGEEGAVLESLAEVVAVDAAGADGNRDCVNCLKSCKVRRDSGTRGGVDVEDVSWEVSEDKDLTRVFI